MTTTRVHAFTDDALGEGDATEVAARIRDGEVTASEVCDAAAARIAAVSDLNAVSEIEGERATRRIDAAQRSRAEFAGVPTAIKENVALAGSATTMGSAAIPPVPAAKDGGFVAQFLSLGVVPLARTTSPPFGWTATTERPGGDDTRNPWDLGYSSGGSSGGTAALVAAGAVPIAHGNDGGGSIRIPASACGLVGLKATRGRVLSDPAMEGAPVKIAIDGVLTRSVRDSARAFAGFERSYANPKLQPIGSVEGLGARRLRIGVTHDSPMSAASDAETRAAIDAAAELLASLGHGVQDFTPQLPDWLSTDFQDYWSFLAWAIRRRGKALFGEGFDASRLDNVTNGLADRAARRLPRVPLAVARLNSLGRHYDRMFGELDLVLTPVLCHTTPEIGYLGADLPFDVHFPRLIDYVGFTPLQNASGGPAISLPLGRTAAGLPLGVMLAARRGQERLLLEIAFELEAAAPFARIQD